MVNEGRLAFNRGDVDAMLRHYDPEAEIFPITAGGIEGRGFRGHEEIRGYRNALNEVFDKVEIHYDDIRDCSHCVVALGHWTIKGRMSGVETTSRAGWVVRFRAGKIVRLDSYTDPADALAAAGVEDWREGGYSTCSLGHRPAPNETTRRIGRSRPRIHTSIGTQRLQRVMIPPLNWVSRSRGCPFTSGRALGPHASNATDATPSDSFTGGVLPGRAGVVPYA